MKYRLAISDFDGTLLPGNRDTVSERTIEAIRSYCEAGGVFGVSTGRAFGSIKQRIQEMGLGDNLPVLCCQGALAADLKTGKIISEIPMPKEAAAEFFARAASLGLQGQLYTDKNVYVPCLNETNKLYFERNKITPVVVGDVGEYAKKTDESILKVMCYITPDIRDKMFPLFKGIEGVKSFTSNPRLFEAVSVNAGKDNGLKALCRRLGVDIAECVAFGDELNDMEMLKAAGLGVAMGNALDEVKNAADYVTDSCDCDGVAKVLERIIKENI